MDLEEGLNSYHKKRQGFSTLQIDFLPLVFVTLAGVLLTICTFIYGFSKILFSCLTPEKGALNRQIKSQCIVCGETEFMALEKLPYLIRCLRCGLLRPLNIPTEEELHEYYQKDPTGFLGRRE